MEANPYGYTQARASLPEAEFMVPVVELTLQPLQTARLACQVSGTTLMAGTTAKTAGLQQWNGVGLKVQAWLVAAAAVASIIGHCRR